MGRLLRMNGAGLITLELLWIQRSGLSRVGVGVMSGAAYALQVGGWLSDHWNPCWTDSGHCDLCTDHWLQGDGVVTGD